MNALSRLILTGAIASLTTTLPAATSALWGTHGELWSPASRLPDFSYAGYHCGEAPLPNPPASVSLKDFGAVGDGVADDSKAFLKAIATVKSGAIEIPPGRYRITKIIEINRPNVVLRGAGPGKTILFFPTPLNDIKPNWGETTGGMRTSNYSWSGGLIWFQGNFGSKPLAKITADAQRGEFVLTVSDTSRLSAGQRVEIFERDNPDNSLAKELYSGDAGDTRKLEGSTHATLVCHITRIDGHQIHFDRPLRFAVKAQWHPQIRQFAPTVSESGVENLTFEFPNTRYGGHFKELGYNAIAFSGVSDCWACNLVITNADSGIMPGGMFCTIQDIVFESSREPDKALHCTGHHGMNFEGADNLFTGFDYRTRFVHDISVDHCAVGNVMANGRGIDLCFDHHERAPSENLFTDIDTGAGTRLWTCGGGDALGKHCGTRGTFWNIRAAKPQTFPPASFGPPSMNLVGVQPGIASVTEPNGRWFEAIAPGQLSPPDIHAAQLARRLGAK